MTPKDEMEVRQRILHVFRFRPARHRGIRRRSIESLLRAPERVYLRALIASYRQEALESLATTAGRLRQPAADTGTAILIILFSMKEPLANAVDVILGRP